MSQQIDSTTDASLLTHAQSWQDAETLTAALEPQGRRCLSVGGPGDNAFALLAAGAEHVVAVESNPAQVACIELRRAAYLKLDHDDFLELYGSRKSSNRPRLYQECRGEMLPAAQTFWDANPKLIAEGIGNAGALEKAIASFRTWKLPLAHSSATARELFEPRQLMERHRYFESVWNTKRYAWVFKAFLPLLWEGLGANAELLKADTFADHAMARMRHALVVLDPSTNPYLHWLLLGGHGEALPFALREDKFLRIRKALEVGRFTLRTESLPAALESEGNAVFEAIDLGLAFENLSEAESEMLMMRVARSAKYSCQISYWNLLAPRSHPAKLAPIMMSHTELAKDLQHKAKTFFYNKLVIEERIPPQG